MTSPLLFFLYGCTQEVPFASEQNCVGDLDSSSQEQLDSYTGLCAIIESKVLVRDGVDIVQLDALSEITGSLYLFSNPILTDILSLSSLTTVRGDIGFNNSHMLADLDPLSAVTFVGGDLHIHWNDAIQNLSGLSQIDTVQGSLEILKLKSITDPFPALHSVGENVQIDQNPSFSNSMVSPLSPQSAARFSSRKIGYWIHARSMSSFLSFPFPTP